MCRMFIVASAVKYPFPSNFTNFSTNVSFKSLMVKRLVSLNWHCLVKVAIILTASYNSSKVFHFLPVNRSRIPLYSPSSYLSWKRSKVSVRSSNSWSISSSISSCTILYISLSCCFYDPCTPINRTEMSLLIFNFTKFFFIDIMSQKMDNLITFSSVRKHIGLKIEFDELVADR